MKICALVSILVSVLVSIAAAVSTITNAISPDGTLTIAHEGTQSLWSLEWSPDLGTNWMPTAFWNMPITTNNASFRLRYLPEHAFFRTVSSSQVIQPTPNPIMQTTETNHWGSVSGRVMFLEGNFMPGAPSGTVTPVERTLCFFEKTRSADGFLWSSMIFSPFFCSTESNTNGYFSVAIPPGDYTLVVMESPGRFYANGFDGFGNIYPIHVETNQNVEITFNISYAAEF